MSFLEFSNTNFLEDKKKNCDLSNCQSQSKKKVKPVNVVNYNINAANCDVISMMQYVHCLHNLRNQSTAICQQIIRVNIEVEYFSDNIIYHYQPSVYFFV